MLIGAQIEWRKDEFGREDQALYLGELNVGHIMPSTSKDYHPGEWRGWFNSDESGSETGWWPTAEEARKSVESFLFAAIKFIKG